MTKQTNPPQVKNESGAETKRAGSLLVFADDWGRHPSSCQHLVSHLLPQYPVYWVNTIGMRPPRLDRVTFRRAFEKLRPWLRTAEQERHLPGNLRVIDPKMWPWFRRGHDRWLNQRMMLRGLKSVVAQLPRPVVGLTTLPIVADLLGLLALDRWVYYCVDDFSEWPGLDQNTLAAMEDRLIEKADCLVAASEKLQTHLAEHGRAAHLLTHGVDLEHWRTDAAKNSHHHDLAKNVPPSSSPASLPWTNFEPPLVVFWGLIDRRMDVSWVQTLAQQMRRGTILLVGPQEHPDPALLTTDRVVCLPPMPYEQLPGLAQAASVLVMPYADLPVTRAMQPLKLKEYLATGKPVVARHLPAVEAWADCLDAPQTSAEFASAVLSRLETGLVDSQQTARRRLQSESWEAKAIELEQFALKF